MVFVSREGAPWRDEWSLEPGLAYLNHGGFGLTPNSVLAVQDSWRARIERNPTRFLTFELEDLLREATAKVAAAVKAKSEDLVFVENATSGLNAVLRGMDFEPGDEILMTSLAYPAIRKAGLYAASRVGARLVEAEIKLPLTSDADILRAVASRLTKRTRLAVFDHVASHSAIVMPVAMLTRIAHEAGASVMIDGAHAPGMIALDVPAVGADWYVGNLHKWFFAPRSCGFLWAAKPVQAGTHPLAISHGFTEGFRVEFEWTGTRDVTAALAAPAGIDFHARLGGAALMTRNQDLVREAATELARDWGTDLIAPAANFAAMAVVRLPLAGDTTPARAGALMRELAERHNVAAAVVFLADALWVRIAAQAYNEPADYRRLAPLFRRTA